MSELEAIQDLKIIPSTKAVFGPRRHITFDNLIAQHIELVEAIKQMEAEKKQLSEKIMSWLADHDTKTVMSNDTRVTMVQGEHSTIDKIKLAENGVPPSTILACTKTTAYTFVKITKGGTK